MALGDIGASAGKRTGKRRKRAGGLPVCEIFGDRFPNEGGGRFPFAIGQELQIALQRLGYEDCGPFHMMYDSIHQPQGTSSRITPSRLFKMNICPFGPNAHAQVGAGGRRVALLRVLFLNQLEQDPVKRFLSALRKFVGVDTTNLAARVVAEQ